jgi:hypothetical protein
MTTEFNSETVRKRSKEHISKLVQIAEDRVQRGCFLKPGTYQKYIDYLRTKPVTGATEPKSTTFFLVLTHKYSLRSSWR